MVSTVTVLRRSASSRSLPDRGARRFFGGFAVLATIVMIAALGGTRVEWYLPIYAAIFLMLALAGILVTLGQITADARPVFLAALAVVLLPLAQLGLGTTVDRSSTENGFLHLLAAAAVFWLVAQASRDRGFRNGLLRLLAAGGGALAALGVMQRSMTPNAIYGIIKITTPGAYPVGPFVNHNDFAGAIELLLPAALFLGLRNPSGEMSVGWLLVAGADIASVIVSRSRGGALAVAAEVVLALTIVVFGSNRRRKQAVSRRVGVMAAVLGLLILFAVASGIQPLLQRFQSSGVTAHTRLELDRSSLAMGLAKPVLGQGIGTWARVYPSYARFDDGLIYDAAHCEYAQWWAESGLVGCALLLVMAISFGWTVERRWNSLATVAGCVAILGFCVHASMDFLWHIPGLALLFAVVAGNAVSGTVGETHGKSIQRSAHS